MNNNDERDYAEENYNRALMEEEDWEDDYEIPSDYSMRMEPSLRYYSEDDLFGVTNG